MSSERRHRKDSANRYETHEYRIRELHRNRHDNRRKSDEFDDRDCEYRKATPHDNERQSQHHSRLSRDCEKRDGISEKRKSSSYDERPSVNDSSKSSSSKRR